MKTFNTIEPGLSHAWNYFVTPVQSRVRQNSYTSGLVNKVNGVRG